jgi:hypothetical protein
MQKIDVFIKGTAGFKINLVEVISPGNGKLSIFYIFNQFILFNYYLIRFLLLLLAAIHIQLS